jgi:hypothetical protein
MNAMSVPAIPGTNGRSSASGSLDMIVTAKLPVQARYSGGRMRQAMSSNRTAFYDSIAFNELWDSVAP